MQVRYNGAIVSQANAALTVSGLPVLLWSDEFTGNSLSLATDIGGGSWRTRGTEGGYPIGTIPTVTEGYLDFAGSSWNISPVQHPDHSPFAVANSILTITCRRNPGLSDVGGATWLGGVLVSNYLRSLTWGYGYFEWRMRLPNPVRGMYPALWLLGNSPGSNGAKDQAEIDVFEVFGNSQGSPFSVGYHGPPAGNMDGGATVSLDTTQWHRYGLEFTATTIVYYLDGAEHYRASAIDAAWFNGTTYGLRMNYAMDPNWEAENSPYHSQSNDPVAGAEPRMEIDYIRVYSAKPAQPLGSDDPLNI